METRRGLILSAVGIDSGPLAGARVFQNVNHPRRGASPGSSTPWAPLLALVGFVGLAELVGVSAGAITADNVRTWYLGLTPPPGTPPTWVFGPVWTALYLLIGVSAWLVWRQRGHRPALLLWGWQLAVNALWTPAFFGLHSPPAGLVVIAGLIVMIVLTIRAFARLRPRAALLIVPYLLWTCYAAYLNAGFVWLNPQ